MIMMGRAEINYEIANGMRLIGMLFIVLHLAFLITNVLIMKNFNNLVEDVINFKCTDKTTEMIFKYVD